MRNKLIVAGIVLQIAMVIAGHFNETVLGLSALLGTGIPFVLGAILGVKGARSFGNASLGGFLIGIVGAVIGVLLAIFLGDAAWTLLTFAPLSSGITGLLGAVLSFAVSGRKTAAA